MPPTPWQHFSICALPRRRCHAQHSLRNCAAHREPRAGAALCQQSACASHPSILHVDMRRSQI